MSHFADFETLECSLGPHAGAAINGADGVFAGWVLPRAIRRREPPAPCLAMRRLRLRVHASPGRALSEADASPREERDARRGHGICVDGAPADALPAAPGSFGPLRGCRRQRALWRGPAVRRFQRVTELEHGERTACRRIVADEPTRPSERAARCHTHRYAPAFGGQLRARTPAAASREEGLGGRAAGSHRTSAAARGPGGVRR